MRSFFFSLAILRKTTNTGDIRRSKCLFYRGKVRVTVEHLVLESLRESVGDRDFYLCMDEECDIVYYNTVTSFSKQQVKVPIWFKNDANPKYACYCSKVTEEQVINAVVNDGADNMKEVLRITGAMKDAQCQKNNPLGKCCHHIIQKAIDKGLSMRQLT